MADSKNGNDGLNEKSEFEELFEVFSNMIITTDVFTNDFSGPKEYKLINILNTYKSTLISGVNNKAGMDNKQRLFFFNIFPKLAVHELAENVALQGVQYRLFRLNKKGLRFLAYYDKKQYRKKLTVPNK